jgi:hypothetical protein
MDELMGAGLVSSENGRVYALTGKGKTFLDKHEIYSRNCKSLRERLDLVEEEKAFLEGLSCPGKRSDSVSRKSIKEARVR